jgi:uncharacterized Zn finger protein
MESVQAKDLKLKANFECGNCGEKHAGMPVVVQYEPRWRDTVVEVTCLKCGLVNTKVIT